MQESDEFQIRQQLNPANNTSEKLPQYLNGA